MIELTKLDVQKMASDILKVAPESLDVELQYVFFNSGSLWGNSARYPYVLRRGDMTLYYVVGGYVSAGYTPNAMDDLPLYGETPFDSSPWPLKLADFPNGGFFCSSLVLGSYVGYSFSLVFYRISVR